MDYKIKKGKPPKDWNGIYYLMCGHKLNGRSMFKYLMYCNMIKHLPGGRAKIKVFGSRCTSLDGERIRYVERCRVVLTDAFK